MTSSWAGTLAGRGAEALMSNYGRYPIELASGSGSRVFDAEGREYLDMVAGIAVTSLGHRHPAVVAALRDASEGLIHTSNLYWTEPMVRLAERITEAAGMDRVFFCNSGAEAIEAAIKLGRKLRPGRSRIVAFEGSFHGRTVGALSVTARPAYQTPFRPLLPDVEVLPFGDFSAAESTIDASVSMVLVEPIQGEGGIHPAPEGWLERLRGLSSAAGALLVFDEVQTGMGRTGALFAYQGEGVVPDAVTVAKALAGGLPMGALLARGEAATAFQPGDHGSTFGGGPLVASVANAVLDVVLQDGFMDEVAAKGARLADHLEAIADDTATVTGARGRGLMQGLVLRDETAADVISAAMGMGMLTCPAGPDVVRLTPALTISEEEIDEGAQILRRALSAPGGKPN